MYWFRRHRFRVKCTGLDGSGSVSVHPKITRVLTMIFANAGGFVYFASILHEFAVLSAITGRYRVGLLFVHCLLSFDYLPID